MKRLISLTLVLMMLMTGMVACSDATGPADTSTDPGTTDTPVTAAPTTTAAPQTTAVPETTAAPETTAPPETEPVAVELPYVNPLTGLPSAIDSSAQRPVAVMLNNLRIANPQIGIGQADILYECLVEGGITRLMGVFSDYSSLETLGSVRSSRDYYIDFAQNHDAIYVCAGGSPQAYSELYSREINFLCGVNMYTPNTFYRDQSRINSMGYEHSLMTSGSGIVSGISFKGYRTTLKSDFTSPFIFDAETNSAADGVEAKHLILTYSASQVVQMIYSEASNTYYRFQFGDVAHVDGATNQQLNFTNVLLIYHTVKAIPGDTSGRLAVTTTGSGKGYYISGGKAVSITWKKDTRDSVIQLTTSTGEPLNMAPGKTFVSILPTTAESTTVLNHK